MVAPESNTYFEGFHQTTFNHVPFVEMKLSEHQHFTKIMWKMENNKIKDKSQQGKHELTVILYDSIQLLFLQLVIDTLNIYNV